MIPPFPNDNLCFKSMEGHICKKCNVEKLTTFFIKIVGKCYFYIEMETHSINLAVLIDWRLSINGFKVPVLRYF